MSDIQAYELYKEEKFENSISLFETHVKKNPNDVKAIYHLAIAYRRLNDHIKSLQLLERCSALVPEDIDILSERGVGKFHLNDKPGALEDMDKCVEVEPENPYRYSCRAFIKSNMDDDKGAIEDYEIAVKLDPRDAIALNNLGMLEEKYGRMQAAKRRFKKADDISEVDTDKVYSSEFEESLEKSQAIQNNKELTEANSNTTVAPTPKQEKLTFKTYLETFKYALGSKKGRKEFFSFLTRQPKKD